MTEKLAAEIVKKSGGIMRDTGMTSATPKPRAGEHTWHDDKMLILALRDEVDALAAQLETCKAAHISNCLDADKLRAQKRELREALEGILAAADNSLGIWTPMIEPFKIARAALAKVCA